MLTPVALVSVLRSVRIYLSSVLILAVFLAGTKSIGATTDALSADTLAKAEWKGCSPAFMPMLNRVWRVGGRFIVIEERYLAVSGDGVRWSLMPFSGFMRVKELVFLNGRYVVAGGSTVDAGEPVIASSADLLTWTIDYRGAPGGAPVETMAVLNGVAVATQGRNVLRSTDGRTWKVNTQTLLDTCTQLAAAEGWFVAAIAVGGGGMRSQDGVTWSWITFPGAGNNQGVCHQFGKWWFAMTGGLWSSADGLNWTHVNNDITQRFSPLESSGIFIKGGFSGQYCSFDGTTWTKISLYLRGTHDSWTDMVAGNGMFVGVTTNFGYGGIYCAGTPLFECPTFQDRVLVGKGETQQIQVKASGFERVQLVEDGVVVAESVANDPVLRWYPSTAGAHVLELWGRTAAGDILKDVPLSVTVSAVSSRIVNLSVRSITRSREKPLIMGFVVGGTSKKLLMRGGGPILEGFDVKGFLPDPQLELHGDDSVKQAVVAFNDNWGSGDVTALKGYFTATGAYEYKDTASKDATLVQDVQGLRTLYAYDSQDRRGVVLMELFDVDQASDSRLVNVSARNFVGVGDEILVAGFVVKGNTRKTLLIRGIGPTLGMAPFSIPGVLTDPLLKLFRIEGTTSTQIGGNDDWSSGSQGALREAFVSTGAFNLPDTSSKDAAFIVDLEPGVYTVELHGKGGASGEGMVEVYELK